MFLIDSETALYGVAGHPVRHSLSPRLHNAAFAKSRINAVYLAFDIEPNYFKALLRTAPSLGIKGLNVTIPHKEAAFKGVNYVPSALDRKIGAINTIVFRNGKSYGYNTDAPGLLEDLRSKLHISVSGARVLLVGAGGSARAAAFGLAQAGASEISVLNRTLKRSQRLASELSRSFPKTMLRALRSPVQAGEAKFDLVINATPCGMQNDAVAFDLSYLRCRPAVYDLVYTARRTPFQKKAASLGLKNANGLGMLVAQAAIAFGIWTGKTTGVRQAMQKALR